MPKIKRYELIGFQGILQFNNGVNAMIEDGWQPYGSPFDASIGYFQAMVKYE